jgi:hypothetical protein
MEEKDKGRGMRQSHVVELFDIRDEGIEKR